MTDHSGAFRALELTTLKPDTGYARAFFQPPNPVGPGSSALEVMTDLRFVTAATVRADVEIESAIQRMIARGIRSLLVVDGGENVVGIITSRDVMGDRPTRAAEALNLRFSDLHVRDVMTPGEEIEVMHLDEVLHARVGDIVETLRNSGRHHALVIEDESFSGKTVIRGIFSASQIARQLGIVLYKHDLAQTFSEIDRAMSGKAG